MRQDFIIRFEDANARDKFVQRVRQHGLPEGSSLRVGRTLPDVTFLEFPEEAVRELLHSAGPKAKFFRDFQLNPLDAH